MTNITATIIADSVSAVNGKRITTFELEYPRFIHAEFMTHRMISKNSASSRAIPVKAMLENVSANPAMPSHWGKNQAGMQANEECNEPVVFWYATDKNPMPKGITRENAWLDAMDSAIFIARAFSQAGYHKQIVNRLTEPFQMIKVVATATEWDNFFWLRNHKDAQPEIRILAEKMLEARNASVPEVLQVGEWHVPYVKTIRFDDGTRVYCDKYTERTLSDGTVEKTWTEISKDDALKVSSSMCAQVSYRKADDTLEKALMVYSRLVESEPVHASPFEHQASPMKYTDPLVILMAKVNGTGDDVEEVSVGCTAIHKELGVMSGNFASWVQHRQIIPNNTCWNYTYE